MVFKLDLSEVYTHTLTVGTEEFTCPPRLFSSTLNKKFCYERDSTFFPPRNANSYFYDPGVLQSQASFKLTCNMLQNLRKPKYNSDKKYDITWPGQVRPGQAPFIADYLNRYEKPLLRFVHTGQSNIPDNVK